MFREFGRVFIESLVLIIGLQSEGSGFVFEISVVSYLLYGGDG